MSRVSILNAEFDAITQKKAVEQIIQAVKDDVRGWLSTVNVAILMMMRDDPRLQAFVDKAKWVVADGQPLIWTAPLYGGRLPERVTGIELFEQICAEAEKENIGIYLLGAQLQVANKVSESLRLRYPNLQIKGVDDGYFAVEESNKRAEAIRESGAKILFVAMGVPRQEDFIETQWQRLGVNVAIGIGGSFEVLAGMKKRAPLLIQRLGLEWLFRLLQEPRRLGKRYLVTNTRFLYLVGKTAMLRGFNAMGLKRG